MSSVCKFSGNDLDSTDRCPFVGYQSYNGQPTGDIIKFEGNSHYNSFRGGNLRGRYGANVNAVRLLDGPTVVNGDFQIDGDLLVKGSVGIDGEFRSQLLDMTCKVTNLEYENSTLKLRCLKMESFVDYLCEKMNISIEDIAKAKTDLAKRDDVNKRLDAIL